jgi:hypothetical protein
VDGGMTRRRLALTTLVAVSLAGLLGLAPLFNPGGGTAGIAGVETHTVTIVSGPSGTVTSTDAAFSYISSARAIFACSLDGGVAAACGDGLSGSISYSGLGTGGHTFVVTARVLPRDEAEARRSWTVAPPPPPPDTTPPETTISSAVAGPLLSDGQTLPLTAGTVPLNVATFTFSANEPSRFTCALDARVFACVSPFRNPHLAAGAHRFEVYAIDLAGNRDLTPAAVSWTIGTVGRTLRLPAKRMNLALGPHLLRARDLQRMPRFRAPRAARPALDELEEREVEGRDEPGDDECVFVGCSSPEPGVADGTDRGSTRRRPSALPPSPALTSGPFDFVASGYNDPNLAASSGFLVATLNGTILFLNKAGQLLTSTKDGASFPGSISARQFFRFAFDPSGPNLNTNLNLPKGLACNPTIDLFDGDPSTPKDDALSSAQTAATLDCLRSVYDSRVVFDDFRKRFWILSVVRNHSGGYFKGLVGQQKVGHRDVFLVAVSVDEDPRDGWWVYVFPSTLDLGACNTLGSGPQAPPQCPGTVFRPGDGVDFPSIGISKDYVVTTVAPSQLNPFTDQWGNAYTSIVAFSASQLAKGVCQPGCGFAYGRIESLDIPFGASKLTVTAKHPEAAVQHSVAGGGYALVVANHPASDLLLVLGFRDGEGFPPPLQTALVPVQPEVDEVPDMPQPILPPFNDPLDIKVSNISSTLPHAAAFGNHLFTAWMDCKKWSGQSTCSTSIRLAAVDVLSAFGGNASPPSIDRTFGKRSQTDPEGALVYYGNAGVEVNKNLDAVVVYNRSGREVFPEARYSAYLHNEGDIRPSAVLERGASKNVPIGGNKMPNADPPVTKTFQMDTGGIAVDPYDDVGIWMLHSYISPKRDRTPTERMAIGKVFGSPQPDLSIITGVGIHLSPPKLRAGAHLIITGKISNDGDGRSRATEPTVYLIGKGGSRHRLARFAVPPLASGGAVRFRASATLPARLEPGSYELEVVLPTLPKEYSTKNNVGRRTVRMTSR